MSAEDSGQLKQPHSQGKLQPQELITFCTQIALFLRAGIPLDEGIALLEEDVHGSPLAEALLKVNDHIQAHEYFHVALKKSGCFPDYLCHMAEIGEASGKTDDIMDSLAKFYTRELALKQRIRNAVTYPLTLIVMMSLVVLLLIAKVLPLFENILISLGSQMPTSVKAIMTVSHFFSRYWLTILIVLAAICLVGRLWGRTEDFFDQIKISLPGLKQTYQKIYAERFANAMAFMLEAGIHIVAALELAKPILNNHHMQGKIQVCIDLMGKGEDLHEALYQSQCFPKKFTRMIGLAQKTGELDVIMYRLAGIYEQEVNTSLKKATAVIEPALVIVLSVIVGIILISIMLPLVNIMSSIG